MRKAICIISALALFITAGAKVVDFTQERSILSFEDGTGNVSAARSSAEISDEHYKLGLHSLKWQWKKGGAEIIIPGEIPYPTVFSIRLVIKNP